MRRLEVDRRCLPDCCDFSVRRVYANVYGTRLVRDIRHWLSEVDGRHPVYAGIGLDIPGNDGAKRRADPAYTQQVVRRSLQAGARGIVYCREYEEIRLATLRLCRDALGQFGDAHRSDAT